MGKNNNKPVRLPPPPGGGEPDFEEKPFHSKQYEQEYLDSLLNAPERQTWDEFKEAQRKKGEMESQTARAEEAAQIEFRRQLDAERAGKLTKKQEAAAAEKANSSKTEKEKKKSSKKERHKKKKRRRDDSSDSDSDDSEQEKKSKKKKKKKDKAKADGPVSMSSFFNASDSE